MRRMIRFESDSNGARLFIRIYGCREEIELTTKLLLAEEWKLTYLGGGVVEASYIRGYKQACRKLEEIIKQQWLISRAVKDPRFFDLDD